MWESWESGRLSSLIALKIYELIPPINSPGPVADPPAAAEGPLLISQDEPLVPAAGGEGGRVISGREFTAVTDVVGEL